MHKIRETNHSYSPYYQQVMLKGDYKRQIKTAIVPLLFSKVYVIVRV